VRAYGDHLSGQLVVSFEGERSVAINPQSKSPADIVLYSEKRDAQKLIVNGPGEYEIAGVSIVTARVAGASSGIIHAVNLDGVNVLLVLESSARLSEENLYSVGTVDVLSVNSGEPATAEALAIDLSPRVVIPFGDHADQLCVMLGARDATPQPRFSWNGSSAVAKALLLKPQVNPRRSTGAA
jgi:hypothetical protein